MRSLFGKYTDIPTGSHSVLRETASVPAGKGPFVGGTWRYKQRDLTAEGGPGRRVSPPAPERDQLGLLAITVFAGSAGYPPGGQMVGTSAFGVWLIAVG